MNAKVGTNCSNYAVARTYLRDGQAPEVVKKRPFYMLDSTYTVASNPNTMRDTGPLRNAQYKVADPADFEYMLKTASGAKQSREEEQAIEKAMKARCTHNRP